MQEIIDIVEKMKSGRVANYVIAGLDSYLLENGKVRLFKNSRNHQDQLTPHSHRFDFACMVLQGEVTNHLWEPDTDTDNGDLFRISKIKYLEEVGKYEKVAEGDAYYDFESTTYYQGEIYSMKSNEIHSITFSKDAIVLFFEGPAVSDKSLIIEPLVNGKVIPTSEVKPYMFLKE